MEKHDRKISNPEFEAAAKALKATGIPFILVGILESEDNWIVPDHYGCYHARANSTATAVNLLKLLLKNLENQADANGAEDLARFCRAIQVELNAKRRGLYRMDLQGRI